MTKKVVLVTGGTGLVGNGIRIAHERDPRDDETFVFLSSKDADLTDKESTRKVNMGKHITRVFAQDRIVLSRIIQLVIQGCVFWRITCSLHL